MSEIAQSWLDTQCRLIPDVERAVIVRTAGPSDQSGPIAVWPRDAGDTPEPLLATAHKAAHRGTAMVGDPSGAVAVDSRQASLLANRPSILACPLYASGGPFGAVAVSIRNGGAPQQQAVLKLMRWGAAWFDLLDRSAPGEGSSGRLVSVVETVATALEQHTAEAAALAAANELARSLGCMRVSIGLRQGSHVRIIALSNSAKVESRSNLLRALAAAMDEALDQDATVVCPPPPGLPPRVAFAQEVLYEKSNRGPVCSTPLYSAGTAVGALTLERGPGLPFEPVALELIESFAALFGPMLELKAERDRPIGFKLVDALRNAARRLLGPRHYGLKLASLALTGVVAFLGLANGDYRVTAQATIEGRVKRIIAAPQDGFIASAEVRAGDRVEKNQMLATLDARDLELERVKLTSEHEQLAKERRAAAGERDRSATTIARAQMKQVRAKLALIEERLARTRLMAPFAGVVVSGDLSQALGAPVKTGEVLFEVAPLDAYRVVLEVDERDIGDVSGAHAGMLALTGLPDTDLPLEVTRMLPISTPRDGRNYFKLEAELGERSELLRPGMQGVAKIAIDERRIAWIWGHTLLDWLRLQWWRWSA